MDECSRGWTEERGCVCVRVCPFIFSVVWVDFLPFVFISSLLPLSLCCGFYSLSSMSVCVLLCRLSVCIPVSICVVCVHLFGCVLYNSEETSCTLSGHPHHHSPTGLSQSKIFIFFRALQHSVLHIYEAGCHPPVSDRSAALSAEIQLPTAVRFISLLPA